MGSKVSSKVKPDSKVNSKVKADSKVSCCQHKVKVENKVRVENKVSCYKDSSKVKLGSTVNSNKVKVDSKVSSKDRLGNNRPVLARPKPVRRGRPESRAVLPKVGQG